jgi:tetrahydromethanopterin S-methyltransferase subunit G
MEPEAIKQQLEKEARELEAFLAQVNQEIGRRQGRLQLLRELLEQTPQGEQA